MADVATVSFGSVATSGVGPGIGADEHDATGSLRSTTDTHGPLTCRRLITGAGNTNGKDGVALIGLSPDSFTAKSGSSMEPTPAHPGASRSQHRRRILAHER